MLHHVSLTITCLLLSYFHVHAQHRYVVVDMETGVPQRDVRIRWDRKNETHTIWDGSFKVDVTPDSIELFKPGYMTRKMKAEELTDTIGILPTFNKLSELVVYGEYKPRGFGWSLAPSGQNDIIMSVSPKQSINVDITGWIENLFTWKKRKRLKKTKGILEKY